MGKSERKWPDLKPGWSYESILTLGAPKRVGGEFFLLGNRPGVCVVNRAEVNLLMVGDEFGYLLIYEDFLSDSPKPVNAEKVGRHNDREPLGDPASSNPDSNIYPTGYPSCVFDGFDIVACYSGQGDIRHSVRLDDEYSHCFTWPWTVLAKSGIPAAFQPEKNGPFDLLVGGFDGSLLHHKRIQPTQSTITCQDQSTGLAFDSLGVPVYAGDEPVHFADWCYPCVVEWDESGRRDLLIGTADGTVYFLRGIGGPKEVKFERPTPLMASSGVVKVNSFAAPTTVRDENGASGVLVADGNGELYFYALEERRTMITSDLASAFASSRERIRENYEKGKWWLRRQVPGAGNGVVITNCPVTEVDSANCEAADKAMENLPDELELDIDLGREGAFEIHVGFYEPEFWSEADLQLPIGDIKGKCFVKRADGLDWSVVQCDEILHPLMKDVFLGVEQMKDGKVRFRPIPCPDNLPGAAWPVCIDYVRLVPCDDVAADSVPSVGPLSVRGIADVAMWCHRQTRLRSQEDMDVLFGAHRNAGFDLLYYKLGGAAWEYPSKVPGAKMCFEPPLGEHARTSPWGPNTMKSPEGVDRLRLAVKSAKKCGMRLFGWIRLQNYGEHINNGFPVSTFHRDHQELWENYRSGKPCQGKMSLAFPDVRRFLKMIIKEAMSYGLDGILIDFLRQLPAVLYATPVRELFRRRHGEDAGMVPPTDPRLLRIQAEFTDLFLWEVRTLLDQFIPKGELHVRLAVPRLGHGLDPAAIAASGNVNEIIVEHRGVEPREPDFEGMMKIAAETGCQIVPSFQRVYWGKSRLPMRPDVIQKTVGRLYAQGARAVCFYECTEGALNPNYCRAIRRLSDSKERFSIQIHPRIPLK